MLKMTISRKEGSKWAILWFEMTVLSIGCWKWPFQVKERSKWAILFPGMGVLNRGAILSVVLIRIFNIGDRIQSWARGSRGGVAQSAGCAAGGRRRPRAKQGGQIASQHWMVVRGGRFSPLQHWKEGAGDGLSIILHFVFSKKDRCFFAIKTAFPPCRWF